MQVNKFLMAIFDVFEGILDILFYALFYIISNLFNFAFPTSSNFYEVVPYFNTPSATAVHSLYFGIIPKLYPYDFKLYNDQYLLLIFSFICFY